MATNATPQLTRARRAALLQGIYVIVNETPRALELARAVIDAGVRILQYRAKTGIVPQRLRDLRALTRRREALLIMNDDWRSAVEYDCDGVHLGPGDEGFDRVGPVRIAMVDRIIGLSCATIDEVRAANVAGVDYLGVGSIYATASKDDAGEPIGLPGLRALVKTSAVPVAAVGGISATTISDVRRGGAAMAAIIGAVATASDPSRAARALIDAWNS